jgi:hypothetical protein
LFSVAFEYEGKEYKITGPSHVEEILYSAWIDFRLVWEKYSALEKEQKKDEAFQAKHILEGLSHFYSGDLEKIPLRPDYLPPDVDFKDADEIQGPPLLEDISLYGLWAYLIQIVGDYFPQADEPYPDYLSRIVSLGGISKDFRFEYKGKTFVIDHREAADEILGIKRGEFSGYRPSTGEAIEALSIDSAINRVIDKEGDPDGGLSFVRDLHMIAVLAREKGRLLPSDPLELERYIEQQGKFFEDLPMPIVLGVKGFFLTITKSLKALGSILVSQEKLRILNSQIAEQAPSKGRRKGRRKKGKKRKGSMLIL